MKNKKVMLLANDAKYVLNLREELLQAITNEGYELTVVTPKSNYSDKFKDYNCKFIGVNYDVHSMNPFHDILLFFKYFYNIMRIKPVCVLTFTIKANIYGSFACRLLHVKCISNITGLGPAFEKNGIFKKMIIMMYKVAVKKNYMIFFQNVQNMSFFVENKMVSNNYKLLPGSGVNLNNYTYLDYPQKIDNLNFLFVARIVKEKGIEEYIKAAEIIKKDYPNTNFYVVGKCEDENYLDLLKNKESNNIIKYMDEQNNVKEFYKLCHCVVFPSYYPEGISNILLESAASGRPIITTNQHGCKETVDDKVSGYLVNTKDVDDLVLKIREFISLEFHEKEVMGKKGREKVSKEFNREIVIREYMENIKNEKVY